MKLKSILMEMALSRAKSQLGARDVNAEPSECLDAQVPSSDGADAVQVMQRALPLFPAPLNRPVISFT